MRLIMLIALGAGVVANREFGRSDGAHAAHTAMSTGRSDRAERQGGATRVPQCAVLDPVASTTWESQGVAHFFYRFVVRPWRPFQLIQVDFHKPGPQVCMCMCMCAWAWACAL